MVVSADQLIRLDLRIADLERRVAQERMNAGSDSHHVRLAERSQMLQMLVRTLDTMKARKVLGASIKKSGRPRQLGAFPHWSTLSDMMKLASA